jgi:hypothetical protein
MRQLLEVIAAGGAVATADLVQRPDLSREQAADDVYQAYQAGLIAWSGESTFTHTGPRSGWVLVPAGEAWLDTDARPDDGAPRAGTGYRVLLVGFNPGMRDLEGATA